MEYDRSKEIFAFYNVENLLLPDAPPVHSADPTISGLRNWDDRKYRQKLNKIAHVAELISASEGVLPMLFGVAEIQGEKALTDVLELPFFKAFRAVHFPSADTRGIDVALLYDPEKVEILSSKTIRLTEESGQVFDTRDILHVQLGFCNEIFNAYVVHFPSRKDRDANFGLRENLVRRLAADIAQNSNSEAVILMGDFNCNPDDKMLLPIFENNSGKQIFNPFADLYTLRFTIRAAKRLIKSCCLNTLSNQTFRLNLPPLKFSLTRSCEAATGNWVSGRQGHMREHDIWAATAIIFL